MARYIGAFGILLVMDTQNCNVLIAKCQGKYFEILFVKIRYKINVRFQTLKLIKRITLNFVSKEQT